MKISKDKPVNTKTYCFVPEDSRDRLILVYPNKEGTPTHIILSDFHLEVTDNYVDVPVKGTQFTSILKLKDVEYGSVSFLQECSVPFNIELLWFTGYGECYMNMITFMDCFPAAQKVTTVAGETPKYEYDSVNAEYKIHIHTIKTQGDFASSIFNNKVSIKDERGHTENVIMIDGASFVIPPEGETFTCPEEITTSYNFTDSDSDFTICTHTAGSNVVTSFEVKTTSTHGDAVVSYVTAPETVFVPHHTATKSREYDVQGKLTELEKKYKTDYGRITIEAIQFFFNEHQRKLCKEFLEYHGAATQFLKAGEEAAELSAEIVKSSLYPETKEYRESVFKEIADLTMLLYQMSISFEDDWRKLVDEHIGNKFIKADLTLQKTKADKRLTKLKTAAIKDMDKIFDAEFELGEIKATLDFLGS